MGHAATRTNSGQRYSSWQRICAVVLVLCVAGCQTLSADRLTWPNVDSATVSCADLAESADTLRQEIRRRGPVPADRELVDEYRAKLAEFEKALRKNECPPPPPVNCADLAASAEILRGAIKRSTSTREPTGTEVAEFIVRLPLITYYWPLIPFALVIGSTQKQEELDQWRAKLAEFEEAMRANGCPAQLPAFSSSPQETGPAQPEKPAPSP
jgi:hypothetical protein